MKEIPFMRELFRIWCILTQSPSQLDSDTFQVLNSHVRLMASVLEKVGSKDMDKGPTFYVEGIVEAIMYIAASLHNRPVR